MKQTHKVAVLCASLATLAPAAHAAMVDFSTGLTNNTALSQTQTFGPITATAWTYTAPATYNSSGVTLWARNQNNDYGLGVCSEGASDCSTLGGDVNELDNMGLDEVIRLDAGGLTWTDLWVSSLDAGGTNNNESGLVYFSDNANENLNTASFYDFDYQDIFGATGDVEGSIWSIINPSAADAQKRYVFFRADGRNGDNNDYLVWKAAVVPIPAAAWLFGSAIVGAFAVGRRRKVSPVTNVAT